MSYIGLAAHDGDRVMATIREWHSLVGACSRSPDGFVVRF